MVHLGEREIYARTAKVGNITLSNQYVAIGVAGGRVVTGNSETDGGCHLDGDRCCYSVCSLRGRSEDEQTRERERCLGGSPRLGRFSGLKLIQAGLV